MYFKTSAQFKQWYLDENDYDHSCQICGKSDRPRYDCEHVMSKGNHPKHKELWNELNLLMVCNVCHDEKRLSKKEEYDKIKEERGLYELFDSTA